MMHPCKNMKHLAGKTCPLVIGGGGTFVDAVWELRNLREVDPVAEEFEGVTPLFRNPASSTINHHTGPYPLRARRDG